MWHNNKSVVRAHCKKNSRQAWAIIAGLSGWKRIRPSTTDGVTNCYSLLCIAQANNRKVNVFLNSSDQIERVTLR